MTVSSGIFYRIEAALADALGPMVRRVKVSTVDGEEVRTVSGGPLASLRCAVGDMGAFNKFYADPRPCGLISRGRWTVDEARRTLTADYTLTLMDDTCRGDAAAFKGSAATGEGVGLDDMLEQAMGLLAGATWDRHRMQVELTGGEPLVDETSGDSAQTLGLRVVAAGLDWRASGRVAGSAG